jgi:hypothetical protein
MQAIMWLLTGVDWSFVIMSAFAAVLALDNIILRDRLRKIEQAIRRRGVFDA